MLDLVSVFMAWRWGCINTYDARKRSVRLRDEGAPQEFLWTMNWFINLELDRSWLMFIIAKYTGLRRSPKWKEKSHGLQINWRSNMEPQEIGVRDEISQILDSWKGKSAGKPNIYSVIRSWLAKQVALLSEFFRFFSPNQPHELSAWFWYTWYLNCQTTRILSLDLSSPLRKEYCCSNHRSGSCKDGSMAWSPLRWAVSWSLKMTIYGPFWSDHWYGKSMISCFCPIKTCITRDFRLYPDIYKVRPLFDS